MHKGYLAASVAALALGVMFILSPKMVKQLSRSLDRSVGSLEGLLLKKRAARYLLGLVLFWLSFSFFRLSYLAP